MKDTAARQSTSESAAARQAAPARPSAPALRPDEIHKIRSDKVANKKPVWAARLDAVWAGFLPLPGIRKSCRQQVFDRFI